MPFRQFECIESQYDRQIKFGTPCTASAMIAPFCSSSIYSRASYPSLPADSASPGSNLNSRAHRKRVTDAGQGFRNPTPCLSMAGAVSSRVRVPLGSVTLQSVVFVCGAPIGRTSPTRWDRCGSEPSVTGRSSAYCSASPSVGHQRTTRPARSRGCA